MWSPPGTCCFDGGDCGSSNSTRDQDVRFVLPASSAGPDYTLRLYLPDGLTCSQAAPCTLQWTYMTGNTEDGYPEVFRNCADFSLGQGGSATPAPTTQPATTAAPNTQPATTAVSTAQPATTVAPTTQPATTAAPTTSPSPPPSASPSQPPSASPSPPPPSVSPLLPPPSVSPPPPPPSASPSPLPPSSSPSPPPPSTSSSPPPSSASPPPPPPSASPSPPPRRRRYLLVFLVRPRLAHHLPAGPRTLGFVLIPSPLPRPPSGEALATQLVLWSPGMGSCATLFESDRRRRLVFRTRTAACCRRGRALQEFILSTLVNS